ncbi:PIN domain nuclease [Micromonospora sp. NPDC018662]|uniref:PIN domain nuclease n=1 Tax=Micromonospora sp. NPDC018662 TaxID=3364238 RepID=UPI003793BA19
MKLADYLIDTSALVRLLRDPDVLDRWEQTVTAGLVAVCPLVELEFLYTARSVADRAQLVDQLRTVFGWVAMPDRIYERAAETQRELTARGTHRSAGAVDLLVAATAECHELSLLHYDRDFDQVGAVTGQPMRWLAPPNAIK